MGNLLYHMQVLASIVSALPQSIESLYLGSKPSIRDRFEPFLNKVFSDIDTIKTDSRKIVSSGHTTASHVPPSKLRVDIPNITVHDFMEQVAKRGYPTNEEMEPWGQFGRIMIILRPLYPDTTCGTTKKALQEMREFFQVSSNQEALQLALNLAKQDA